MTKFLKKTLLVAIMVSSMFFASACSLFDGEIGDIIDDVLDATIESYEITQISSDFETAEDFSIEGAVLTLTLTDGTTQNITLSNDMLVEMPDMSTPGEKTVTITYLGQTYTFTFNVSLNDQEVYQEILDEILTDYQNGQINFSELEATLSGNVNFSFLENTETKTIEQMAYFTEAEMMQFLQMAENGMPADLYEVLRDSVIAGAMSADSTGLIDLAQKTTSMDLELFIRAALEEAMKADYEQMLKANFLVEYREAFEQMADNMAAMLGEGLAQSSVDAISNSIMNNFYNSFVANTQIDMVGFVEDMIIIVENDTMVMPETQVTMISLLETYRDGEYSHALSNWIADVGENIPMYDEIAQEIIMPENETAQQTMYKNQMVTAYYNLALTLENMYANDFMSTLDTLEIQVAAIETAEATLSMANLELLPFQIDYEEVYFAIETAREVFGLDFAALNQRFGVQEMIAYEIAYQLTNAYYNPFDYVNDYLVVEEDVYDYLMLQADSVINGITFDPNAFLTGLEAILVNLDQDVFIQNFHTEGSFMILTTILEQKIEEAILNNPEDAQFEIDMNGLLANAREITEAIDTVFVYNTVTETWDFNSNVLNEIEQGIHHTATYVNTVAENNGQEIPEYIILEELSDYTVAVGQRVLNVLDTFQEEASFVLTNAVADMLQIPEYDSEMLYAPSSYSSYALENPPTAGYQAVENWSDQVIADVLAGTFVAEDAAMDLLNVVDLYATQEVKTIIYATIAASAIITDADVNYNEIMANIELPQEIAAIDFNALVERLQTESTYDFLDLSDVQVQNVMDENGNLTSQVLTLTLNINFDVMVASVTGALELEVVLSY